MSGRRKRAPGPAEEKPAEKTLTEITMPGINVQTIRSSGPSVRPEARRAEAADVEEEEEVHEEEDDTEDGESEEDTDEAMDEDLE